jgi:transcriptional regulator with XRE-family HTH domain
VEQNLTLEILEEKTGISKDLIIRFENATFFPSAIQLKTLMEVLGFSWKDIVVEEKEESVFVAFALTGCAQTDSERLGFGQVISMIVCLRKHDRLRRRAMSK